MSDLKHQYIAFAGHARLASGDLPAVARAVRTYLNEDKSEAVVVFEAASSAQVDLDLRGTPAEAEAKARMMEAAFSKREAEKAVPPRSGPGRPKLGVVGREVTLLPRHWDWLRAQPGGASVTLRKLVEKARKEDQGAGSTRRLQDRAYGFMHALAGDLPGFEEASRALYSWDLGRFESQIKDWPKDLRNHLADLVRPDS